MSFEDVLNPTDHPNSFEKLLLDGELSPGQVSLAPVRTIGWDKKKATGSSGATITRTGDELVEFDATFTLARDPTLDVDEYVEWASFLPVIQKSIAGKVPQPLIIYHPQTAEVDVFQVVPGKIGSCIPDGKGGHKVTVSFIEYKPPKKKGGSPKKNDPNADLRRQVDELTREAQKP